MHSGKSLTWLNKVYGKQTCTIFGSTTFPWIKCLIEMNSPFFSSHRFLRRRPDIRSADTALRHPRQLLPGQHDSPQGQPSGPHHTLAPSTTTSDKATPPPPRHPLDWVRVHPEETETTYFSIPHPCCVRLHFIWNLLRSQSALPDGEGRKYTFEWPDVTWDVCVCVFLFPW